MPTRSTETAISALGATPNTARSATGTWTRRPDHVLLLRALPAADRVRRGSAGAGARERAADAGRRARARRRRVPRLVGRVEGELLRGARGGLQHAGGAGSRVRLDPGGQP